MQLSLINIEVIYFSILFRRYKVSSNKFAEKDSKIKSNAVSNINTESVNVIPHATNQQITDAEKTVSQGWKIIESQCKPENHNFFAEPREKGEWKTIQFFVSSTFTDFHNEREVLVKKVCLWNLTICSFLCYA